MRRSAASLPVVTWTSEFDQRRKWRSGATAFSLAQIDPLRVYVSVPEAAAASMRPGLGAYLVLTQFPGRRFEGKVVRTANAIDLASRTLLTEVDVPNKTGELLPGGYAEVHLEVK